ncbi:Trypomastigote, Alanine, Serine and Valine rich protein (TASV), subfamily A [Trypanosoma cruzi]|uniref:Trypomastigote, Alanine, Serine and Valine rich protein (TASV), subfamily A n=1 Tax=Trypanosoma cruzi TaxID=5693 RepID=A0A2V2W5K2_TRYCR|nr:Trypomastigote, Alanine, Serine and Valine rich protein (TASV), subfamily A [Trypanosoma cruzi]
MWWCVRGWLRGEGQGARCLSLLWELRCIDSPLGSWNPRATLRRVRWHGRAGEGSLRSCVFSPRWTWAAGRLADAAKRGIRCICLADNEMWLRSWTNVGFLFVLRVASSFPVRHAAHPTPTHRRSCLHISCGLGKLFAGACPPRNAHPFPVPGTVVTSTGAWGYTVLLPPLLCVWGAGCCFTTVCVCVPVVRHM